MVVSGEQRAYTRRYCAAKSSNSPSAPISDISAGASAYSSAPTAAPATIIIITAQVKMLSASRFSPRPRLTDTGTDEPTPMRSARAKLIITNGIARLSAAKAVSPRYWPTKTPSRI